MSQTFLFFEQQTRDAEQACGMHAKRAAKEAAAKARADAKEKEETREAPPAA